MSIESPSAEEFICAALRGEDPVWPDSAAESFAGAFLRAADEHGVTALLHTVSRSGAKLHSWPATVREALSRGARMATALDLARREELNRVFDALTAYNIAPLVLKGTALAYTHYPSPGLRPRCDIDLLLPPEDRDRADQALRALDYQRLNTAGSSLSSYQRVYTREQRQGLSHVFDVHWRVSNRQRFANALDYCELRRDAVTIPALGEHAWGLGNADALLLACMHRAAHGPYTHGARLIWIYDIHLLVSGMQESELEAFTQRASARRVADVCADGLIQAQRCFHPPLPDVLGRWLASVGPAPNVNASRLRSFVDDLVSLPSWGERVQFVREHLLPAPNYMRARYTGEGWLPVLYLRRGVFGAWKFLRNRT